MTSSSRPLIEQAEQMLRQGRTSEAQNCCTQALAADADDFEALRLSARIGLELGQVQAGIAMLQHALEVRPGHAQTLYDLGRALHADGQTPAALDCFTAALAADPGNAAIQNAKGIMLTSLGRREEAIAAFRQAVALKPDYASAHNNLGNEHMAAGNAEAALAGFEQAIRHQPGYANAHNGRGSALLSLKNHAEALASFDMAIALDPNHAEAWNGRGNALVNLARLNESLAAFDRAIALKPDFESAHTGRGKLLLMMGRNLEATEAFRLNADAHPSNPARMSDFLFALNYVDTIPAEEIFAQHREFGRRFETPLKAHWQPHDNTPAPDKPLRIGLVSADLRRHSVGTFLEKALGNLPRDGSLVLVAYANQRQDDAVTERLRPHFALWRNIVDLSDDEAAGLIRADGIDILVDLSGHSAENRLLLFARKPAPVQASYLGYFATTGLTAIDYFIGDRWQMPEGEALHFTETPFRMTNHHLCFTPPTLAVPVGPLPALQNGQITFGNFNNLAKMSDSAVSCWASLLKALPGSRLFLKSAALDGADARANVLTRFAGHGIDAGRLILEGKSGYEAYLACYQRVDIALDPFPYVGGTVTMQSLWMGVPVLTLHGDRHVSRNGSGIMQELGLPEWVAFSKAEYVERAVTLAADLTALAGLRAGLRERLLASSLCDAPRFADDLAASFRAMWRNWCASRHGPAQEPEFHQTTTSST